MMANQFYLDWHANFNDWTVVCGVAGIEDILRSLDARNGQADPCPQCNNRPGAIKDPVPAVTLTDQSATGPCWSSPEWGVSTDACSVIDRRDHSIADEQNTPLVEYDCGIASSRDPDRYGRGSTARPVSVIDCQRIVGGASVPVRASRRKAVRPMPTIAAASTTLRTARAPTTRYVRSAIGTYSLRKVSMSPAAIVCTSVKPRTTSGPAAHAGPQMPPNATGGAPCTSTHRPDPSPKPTPDRRIRCRRSPPAGLPGNRAGIARAVLIGRRQSNRADQRTDRTRDHATVTGGPDPAWHR